MAIDVEKEAVQTVLAEEPTTPVSDERELLRQQHLEELLKKHGATWNGPDDPCDPYNWPTSHKIGTALLVSVGQLITLMSTSMVVVPLGTIAHDLRIDAAEAQLVFSVYLLGLGFGPFLVAALSEIYGRKPVWLLSNMWYVLWNSLCPIGHSSGLMIAGRLLSGFGASAGVTLTGPILTDMYRKEERGKSLAIATFLPYLGPAIGPVVGGVVSQYVRWEWLFWVLSIFTAGLSLFGLLCLRESYTPRLLEQKARKEHRVSSAPSREGSQELWFKLKSTMSRSILLLLRRPIMQIIAMLMAVNFGIYCLVLSTFANLWIERYHESETGSSLNYIAIAIGATLASQLGGHVMDWVYRRLRARNGGQTRPEFRMPFMSLSAILVPVGLFWYGWSAQRQQAWGLVDVGVGVFTFGNFQYSQALLAYMYDEFEHAASANAASRMLSYTCAFGFPIFAPQMYDRLGFGWGNSTLAFISLALLTPVPLWLWIWGPRLRALGR